MLNNCIIKSKLIDNFAQKYEILTFLWLKIMFSVIIDHFKVLKRIQHVQLHI